MNENRMNKSMSNGRTPMNFVQRTKKQMKKTNRCTKNKGVQKHASLKKDGVEMRNRPQRMTRYPKKKIDSLSKLSRRDDMLNLYIYIYIFILVQIVRNLKLINSPNKFL